MGSAEAEARHPDLQPQTKGTNERSEAEAERSEETPSEASWGPRSGPATLGPLTPACARLKGGRRLVTAAVQA